MSENAVSESTTWLLRYRAPILLAFAVVTLALASRLGDLRMDFSPQQLYETAARDEAWAYFEKSYELFGRDDRTLFVVLDAGEGGDVLAADHRAWMSRLVRHYSDAAGVEYATGLTETITVRTNDAGELEVLRAGALPAKEILGDPLLVGSLVSANGRMAVARVDFDDSVRDIDDLAETLTVVRAWLADNPAPEGSSVHLGGVPAVRVDAVSTMRAEQLRFAPLVALALCVLLWLAFRRVSRVVFALLVVGLSVLWTVSGMAITGTSIDILNNVLPTLLLVIGISDGLHLMVRDGQEHRAGHSRARALSTSVRTLAIACLLTSLTTAVGFASLGASSTMILVRFGLVVAGGVMISYVLTLGVLPPLLSYAPAPRSSQGGSRGRLAGLARDVALRLGGVALRRPRTVVAASLLLAGALAAVGLSRVNVSVRLTDLYREDHPVSVLQRTLDEELGGVLAMNLMVELPEGEGHRDPEVLSLLAQVQQRIERIEGVSSTYSVADIVGAMHRALVPDDAGALPNSRELLAQEWLVADMGGESFPLESLVAEEGQVLRVIVRVADNAGAGGFQLSSDVERIGKEVFAAMPQVRVELTGDVFMAARNMTNLIRDLFKSLLLASAVIFLTLLVVFRSPRFALVSIVPNVMPLVAVLGFMGLMGMNLDVANVVIFSIALGLAVDDTIHVLARFREERERGGSVEQVLVRTLAGSGQAVVLTSVILGGGLLLLTLSEFSGTARFGGLTALSLGVALVADLMVLPAMLLLVYRRRRSSEPESAARAVAPECDTAEALRTRAGAH